MLSRKLLTGLLLLTCFLTLTSISAVENGTGSSIDQSSQFSDSSITNTDTPTTENIVKKDNNNPNSLKGEGFSMGNMSGLNMSGFNMSGMNMSGMNMSGMNMSGMNMSGMNMSGMNMSGMNMSGMNMSGMNMSGMNMSGMNMSGMNMSGMNMSGMNMSGMNMSGMNMSGFNMSDFNMSGMNMSDFNMSGIDIPGMNNNSTNDSNTNDSNTNNNTTPQNNTDKKQNQDDTKPVSHVVKYKESPKKAGDNQQKVYKTYTVKKASDNSIIHEGNTFTLGALNKLFDHSIINGHLIVYIDGQVVFNDTITDDLSTTLFKIIEQYLGRHNIKIEFTDGSHHTNTYQEDIIIE